MSSIKSYRDLEVWKKSINLVKEIYKITSSFPKEEIYGLTAQLRRASISVPSNIAEGRSRESTKEYLRFIEISYSSIAELETQITIAYELNFINGKCLEKVLNGTSEIGRMLNGLSRSLKKKNPPTSGFQPLTSENENDNQAA